MQCETISIVIKLKVWKTLMYDLHLFKLSYTTDPTVLLSAGRSGS